LWVTGEQLVLTSKSGFFLSQEDSTPKSNPGTYAASCTGSAKNTVRYKLTLTIDTKGEAV